MHSGTFAKTLAATAVAATALIGAGTVTAQAADKVVPYQTGHQWDLQFGATVTSQYIFRGFAQSEGAAFQPWAELDIGPVYLGYWGSNVSQSWVSADWEHDLSIGIRGNHGPFGWDVGYVRYLYNNGDCCGEVYFKGSISPTEMLTLGAAIFYDPDARESYVEANAKLALHNGFSVSGAVGDWAGDFSWNAGISWQPHEWLTIDGRYYGGPTGDGANKFVVSASFATSLKKFGKY